MLDTPEKRKTIGRWIVATFTCCVLIYLGIRHIGNIAHFLMQLAGLFKPLLLGAMLALILNVPMGFWEGFLCRHTKLKKGRRSLAILLSILCVCGIFVGVAFLVLPEFLKALQLIVQIVGDGLSQLAQMESDPSLCGTPLETVLLSVDIDWASLQSQLEEWFRARQGAALEKVVDLTKTMASSIVAIFVGLVFAVYILSGKEKLKRQASRLLRVWLPRTASEGILHVASVCGQVFHRFVAGQTLEAIILGSLCMAGMAILRLPYAPMVGALVGVTALIPIVGAFVGTIVGAMMIMTVSPIKAVIFVVFLLILQQIEGNLIYPRVVGSKLKLPAIWVLAAVTVGGNLGGPLGMLLGVPAASAGYALIREATDAREQLRKKTAS